MSHIFFPHVAPVLQSKGYRPVPISPGTKRPAVPAWPEYSYDPTHRFDACGTGIICGAVIGIDIDVQDAALVRHLVRWISRRFGSVPMRVGRAPRALLVYRAAESSIRKAHTRNYLVNGEDAKVEILATGQQFVAFAVHPDTKKPYEWYNGSPLEIAVSQLPGLTTADIAELLRYANEQLRAATTGQTPIRPEQSQVAISGLHPPGKFALFGITAAINDDLVSNCEKPPVSLDEILAALEPIAAHPGIDNYNDWLAIGQALHHESGGSDEGLGLYIAFSKCLSGFYTGDQPGEGGCRDKWRSFGHHKGPLRTGHYVTKVLTRRCLEDSGRDSQPTFGRPPKAAVYT
jgi:putative DNA primase/helicase